MSYYYRDINGVEHTDTENPFTKAYEYNYFPFMEGPLYTNTSSFYTPIIALKDGSKPVYTYAFISAHGGMPNGKEPFSHVYMATTTFKSKNNQYDLSVTSNPVAQLFQWTKCNNISIKELYKNNEPIINYVDRTKGNMLSWTLKNDKEFYFSAYNYIVNGPHPSAGKDNKCLRIGQGWDNTDNSATHGPFSSNVFLQSPTITLLNIVRFPPEKQNDMFNYTATIKNYEGDYVMSYYTLDIDKIKEKGNKLKLNYFYTILFDGNYNVSQPVTSISEPSNLSADWESNFTNTDNKSPFSFNYYISDESTWNRYGTAPTVPYSTGHNLSSTFGNTTDTHEWKYISRFKNIPLDEWNGDTIKNFYVGNVNNNNQITYSKFTNFKGSFYTFRAFTSIVGWNSDVTAVYPQGSLVKYDGKTYIANWNINTYTAVDPTARNMNSAIPSTFDDEENPSQMWIKVDIEEQNLDYSPYFGNSGHYLSANVDSWKDFSANIIPYVQTLNANCYYDRRHSMQNTILDLTGYPSARSGPDNLIYRNPYNLKNRIWSENIEMYFNDNTYYTKDTDIVSYGGQNYTFNYNYSGYYSEAARNCICFETRGTPQGTYYTAYLYVDNNGTTADIGTIETLFSNNQYVSSISPEPWNRNTSYQQGTIVNYNGKLYQATVDVKNKDINDTIWNPSGYSVLGIENDITNPLYSFKLYKNYFCIGSATHTIDLTDKTGYIHIAFPVTPTLNSGLYGTYDGYAKTWITDLKMSYEAID